MLAAASAVAALLAAAPAASLSEPQLDAAIARAHREKLPARIDVLSKLFLGTPYVDYPLGEGGTGPEPQARWRVDGVDCQTYVETVLAMANSRSAREARVVLDDLRYGAQPPSFATRNHFTEAQWLPANIAKGYLRDETAALDPQAPESELVLNRARWTQVPGLQRLTSADIPEGRFSVRYLPIPEAKKVSSRIAPGTVLMVVRAQDPARVVRVSHMGFVLQGARGPIFRHASTGSERKVIDEDLVSFLDRQLEYRKWPVVGVTLAQPLDAAARARGLSAQR